MVLIWVEYGWNLWQQHGQIWEPAMTPEGLFRKSIYASIPNDLRKKQSNFWGLQDWLRLILSRQI